MEELFFCLLHVSGWQHVMFEFRDLPLHDLPIKILIEPMFSEVCFKEQGANVILGSFPKSAEL